MKIYKPKFWERKNLISYILLPFAYSIQFVLWIKKYFNKERKV